MRVAVLMPVHGDTKAEFTLSLAAMLLEEAGNHQFNLHMGSGSNLPKLRNDLARQALAGGVDRILWLDSDHVFPVDTLRALLAHDVDIVGCNFRRRYGDALTAFKAGKQVEAATGLQEVDSLGLGICLMKPEVFAKAPQPWFVFGLLEDGTTTGEDQFFFARLFKASGIRAHVDHDLSRRVGHIASRVLMLDRPDE